MSDDLDTDVDITLGDKSSTIFRQKTSYLISAHEASNIYATNFFNVVSVAFNEFQAQKTHQHHSDDQLKQFSLAASVISSLSFGLYWLISLRRQHKRNKKLTEQEQKDFYNDIKNQLNPWYRCFKACAFLGNSLGQSIVELLFLIPGLNLIAGKFKSPIKAVVSGILGMIFGALGAAFLADGDDIRYTSDNSLFHIGKDGWGRYAKSGISLGALCGAAIGAVLGFFTPIPGGMAIGIALGSAIGGVIGFGIMTVAVPAINFLINRFTGKKVEKPTPEPLDNKPRAEHTNSIKKNPNRSKYMRSGLGYGVYVGTIVGFILGIIFPFPGATILFIAVGSFVFGAIGSLILGLLGPRISLAINRDDQSYSSFDFGMASGGLVGQMFGNVISGCLQIRQIVIEKLGDLIIAITGLIGTHVGGIYDAVEGSKAQRVADERRAQFLKDLPDYLKAHPELSREEAIAAEETRANDEFEKNRPLVAWSQRVGVFTTYGGMIGGAVGFLIGSLIGGPLVGAACAVIGLGVGGAVAGLIGAKWGAQITEKYVQFSEWVENIFSGAPVTPPTSPARINLSSSASNIKEMAKATPVPATTLSLTRPVPATKPGLPVLELTGTSPTKATKGFGNTPLSAFSYTAPPASLHVPIAKSVTVGGSY